MQESEKSYLHKFIRMFVPIVYEFIIIIVITTAYRIYSGDTLCIRCRPEDNIRFCWNTNLCILQKKTGLRKNIWVIFDGQLKPGSNKLYLCKSTHLVERIQLLHSRETQKI